MQCFFFLLDLEYSDDLGRHACPLKIFIFIFVIFGLFMNRYEYFSQEKYYIVDYYMTAIQLEDVVV